ncbi:hypothetical protein PghCCS26_09580 [Paenibacillus glycanilyticus]|uniref:Uncharacterized protein n=1 Tax=Paenibacillus glycanilyticus TaxID=126569 RepID=A0ABQ6NFE3_9BACL|nr:hypothetical protein PghCCS26_09580 [Paenibacillus glycanilyticus]
MSLPKRKKGTLASPFFDGVVSFDELSPSYNGKPGAIFTDRYTIPLGIAFPIAIARVLQQRVFSTTPRFSSDE